METLSREARRRRARATTGESLAAWTDIARAADYFRRLIDHALHHRGSYYLTYHRFASRTQVEGAHPHIRDFLAAKRAMDRQGIFQSDWYRRMSELLA